MLGISEIAVSDRGEIAVSKKEIFQLALLAHAASIILCHNHPRETLCLLADLSITKDLVIFGSLIDILIVDPLIADEKML